MLPATAEVVLEPGVGGRGSLRREEPTVSGRGQEPECTEADPAWPAFPRTRSGSSSETPPEKWTKKPRLAHRRVARRPVARDG